MTTHTFTINGYDAAPLVEPGGYETNLIPVWSKTVTTRDKVDHAAVVRLRHWLRVTLRAATDAEAAALCDALYQLPAAVVHYNKQQGETVTARMRLDGLPLQELRWRFRGDTWNQAVTLTFTEM